MKTGALKRAAAPRSSRHTASFGEGVGSHARSGDRNSGHGVAPVDLSACQAAATSAAASAGLSGLKGVYAATPGVTAAVAQAMAASRRSAARHDVETYAGTAEPSMVDVLNEPIVRIMMSRDGVDMDALQRVLHQAETLLHADDGRSRDTAQSDRGDV